MPIRPTIIIPEGERELWAFVKHECTVLQMTVSQFVIMVLKQYRRIKALNKEREEGANQ